MPITEGQIAAILSQVHCTFHNWNGFSHPPFVYDEIDYKMATIAKAAGALSESELRRLLSERQSDELIARLERIGKDNNLLYNSVPASGDLGILHQEKLDRAEFCERVVDLLYGPGASPERLQRYVDYVERAGLPNRWTFPTYFLFVSHPGSEMFVKPEATNDFMKLIDRPERFRGKPQAETYNALLDLSHELMQAFADFGPRDMVDVQSLMWVASRAERLAEKGIATPDRRAQLEELLAEFAATYPQTEAGRKHAAMYAEMRASGTQNFRDICAAADRGEDVTAAVLLKLLPYSESPTNREQGAWIHPAPSVMGDLTKWFENKKWTKAEDWPHVAGAILAFVRRCVERPRELAEACAEFSASPYSKGFQCGMLTPILNALRSPDYLVINAKSLGTIQYLTGKRVGQTLLDYPAVNTLEQQLISELTGRLDQLEIAGLSTDDKFDMFCHWLVSVRHSSTSDGTSPNAVRYWKIAPGERAWQWDECRDGGFIAIGWEELGDISHMSREEFETRRDGLIAEQDDWEATAGPDQVWTFAHEIKKGDIVVANQGMSKVLGIGRVTGPYRFVPNIRHGHQRPVDWYDLVPRRVDQPGWRPTIRELDRAKFEEIVGAQVLGQSASTLAAPLSQIFVGQDEARAAFALLRETLQWLGATGPDDERFALTLPVGEGGLLRLNFGNWVVVSLRGPQRDNRVGLSLIKRRAEALPDAHWNGDTFAGTDPAVGTYGFPFESALPLTGDLRAAFEETCSLIRERFQHWKASIYRYAHQPRVAEAVFHPEKLDALLTVGLPEPGSRPGEGYFATKTFDLMEALHHNPTQAFYVEHRDDFKTFVEEPFQQLVRDVAERLPADVTRAMETRKQVFSRIPKNDYGRGGTWDFYWGAFYPQGGKRTEDAQLFVSIDRSRFEFGFFVGDYGTAPRSRLVKNCRLHASALRQILEDAGSASPIIYGRRQDTSISEDGEDLVAPGVKNEAWLQDPEPYDRRAAVILPRSHVLQMSREELCTLVADTFQRLFPLILAATLDEPMPAISDYLDQQPETEVRPVYTLAECAAETGFDEEILQSWVRAIERKKQGIIYGPPGTGKTFVAAQLAAHIVGGADGFTEIVQFHPAYAYEDFMQGIRPQAQAEGWPTFPIVPGRFLEFCREAQRREGRCVLIIDEINRANLARVFGELMYLLEYRDGDIPLAGGGRFTIPKNVRIIGTMNTADRSIALVDHALRRRFAFLALQPQWEAVRRFHRRRNTGFDPTGLIGVLESLNGEIGDPHYSVGISFFMLADIADNLESIWRMEIEPYLEEYFFDRPEIVDQYRWAKIRDRVL